MRDFHNYHPRPKSLMAKMQGQIGFLRDPEFLEAECTSAILSCINHGNWLEKNHEDALKKSAQWLDFLGIIEARDRGYDMEVPLLEGDDEIVKRDVDRTFATAKYRDVLHILLYKCSNLTIFSNEMTNF